jgi:hypothetical protein
VLRGDGFLEPRQLPPQVARPLEPPVEQRLLEPDSVLSSDLF